MYDLKRQYVDYDAYLKTILRGENNIFYSFSTTLGSGMLGFVTYYLSSPFLLILALCPQKMLPMGISIIICLKLMLASFIMDLFLQRHVSGCIKESLFGKKSVGIILCSVSWAFSGYLFAHSMNMMWTDVIILFPLLVWALENLLEYNRKVPYIICLSAMLLLNYYITYQVLLFTALWTIMRIIVRKDKKPLHQIFKVFLSTILPVCIGAFFLLPTALELANSPKDITQLGLTLNGNNLIIRDVFSKLPTLAYDYIEARFGYPQLFCGVLLIILTMLYFLDNKRSKRERAGMFIMFCIMLVSFCRDILNLIWHAGMEPSGHPYRQAFLWVFMMILCSSYAITDMPDTLSLPKLLTVIALTALLFFEVIRKRYDHVSVYTFYANVALLIIYGILLIAYVLLKNNKALPCILITFAMLFVNMGDLGINAVYTYIYQSMNSEKMSDYSDIVSRTAEAVGYLSSTDNSFYRTENLNPRQQNDAMQYGYNGITHYSSAGMTYVRYFLQRLGFNDDNLYTHYGHDNTETADSLLGIKYILSDDMYSAHPDYEKIYDGDEKIYRNPYALGVAVGINGFDLDSISSPYGMVSSDSMENVPELDPFSLQEEIYSRLTGTKVSVFENAMVFQSERTSENDKWYIEYKASPNTPGEVYFYLDGLIGKYESLMLYINGEFVTTYGNAACLKILNLGYMNPGDEITLRVYTENADDSQGTAYIVTERTDALKQAFEKISDNACTVEKLSSSHIKILTGDYEGVFLTIPCEKGWSFTLDGKKVTPTAIYDSLTFIPISEKGDSHTIEMTFIPEGLWIGLAISLAGIAALVYMIIKEKPRVNDEK